MARARDRPASPWQFRKPRRLVCLGAAPGTPLPRGTSRHARLRRLDADARRPRLDARRTGRRLRRPDEHARHRVLPPGRRQVRRHGGAALRGAPSGGRAHAHPGRHAHCAAAWHAGHAAAVGRGIAHPGRRELGAPHHGQSPRQRFSRGRLRVLGAPDGQHGAIDPDRLHEKRHLGHRPDGRPAAHPVSDAGVRHALGLARFARRGARVAGADPRLAPRGGAGQFLPRRRDVGRPLRRRDPALHPGPSAGPIRFATAR